MSWPSGLFNGRFILSIRTTSSRLMATSSGASTSLARLPEMSRTLMRSMPMAFSSVGFQVADYDQNDVQSEQERIPNRRDPNRGGVVQPPVEATDAQGRAVDRRKKQAKGKKHTQQLAARLGIEKGGQRAAGEQSQTDGAIRRQRVSEP